MLIGRREKISEEKAKKLEMIAIVALVAFALISYVISNFVLKNNMNSIAVYKNGEKITQVGGRRIDKNINGTYVIGDRAGEYNVIEIKDKKVRCIESNCPDGICVEHGVLRDDIDNDMIICAPHGLTIMYE